MKYKPLILLILLTGCATNSALSHGQPLDTSLIKCEVGEPYYGSVTTITIFDTMMQSVEVSWQCSENDGARKYIRLKQYHLSMDD